MDLGSFILEIIVIVALFFLVSDSSLNLFFWKVFGRRSEADHYRGKVVWVVGASSGIGEGIALRLARFSSFLILSSRRIDLLETVAQKCREANSSCKVKILPLDIVDFAKFDVKTREADEMFERKVDIVVLNSGRSQRAEWTDIDPSVDVECFQINAIGPTHLARTILKNRGMHPTGDKCEDLQFVIVSSLAAILPVILSPSYDAAKAALTQYFRLLSVEMAEKGIKVSIIYPSHVYAPNMLKAAFTGTSGEEHGEEISSIRNAQMSPQRAAELISLAAVNELHECVIASKPAYLASSYAYVNFPGIFTRVLNYAGIARIRNARGAHQ